ncbi:tetratricopeptide repeat protein [uncultured Bacteroides sp.]|uniref:tetratricopeptide repeat protein n=1 Tax=uncultured Bacteroides sp. TaxID=162156 RepID=UPI002AA78144|nr:tetratricopeptide repeat protein [uncultured Bacteroides sp.]
MKKDTNTLRKEVEKLYRQSKFEKIIALLTNEVLETQKDAKLYAWRARANHRLDYDCAVTMHFAKKAIAAGPTYFMGYFAMALVWTDKKENDKAIADYTKAIEFNPNFADAYYKRGHAWQCKEENNKAIADYDKAIVYYNIAIKTNPKDTESYVGRGNAWYYKENYDNSIENYTKAIEINPNFADAYYNRGLAWFAKKKYNKAIADYTKAVKLNPIHEDTYYIDRGNAWKAKRKYNRAIEDYTKAIKIKTGFENAYYNRGLAKKEENIDLEGSKQDFEKYLELVVDENEIWTKYAKYYIKDLDVMIKDPKLRSIKQLVDNIKDELLIKEAYITHYTSLSVLKSLIFDNSKFRISEGNFMNDPTEGKEFFNFLQYNPNTFHKNGSSYKAFSPKPFIGSFVTKDRHNDLNLWRFYGKEKGVEAKGCAITLRMQNFIDDVEYSLLNEKKEARQDDESDINCYRVVYVIHDESTKFYIPNADKSNDLEILMKELKEKVNLYKGDNKTFLEKCLNNIAFLFKSDAYKNESEVRLVVKGIEFEKEYNMDISSPKVYIELVSIKDIVSHITLGPKVDKVSEWIAAFNYSYKEKVPKIMISHLPYK